MFGKKAAICITTEVTYGVRIQERRMDLLTKEIDSVDGQEMGTGIRGFNGKGERGLREGVQEGTTKSKGHKWVVCTANPVETS